MYQNTLGVTASDPTRYHRVRSTMVHWLLCCGALGTALIIYPACVYLCWTRLCGGGGRKGRQTEFCQAACEKPTNPEGLLALCECVFVSVCVRVSVRESERHGSGSNTVMPTWVMVGLTQTHTHKTFNCQKKSLSRALLCLMYSTLILPFGDICCCVNYTPPGALINTHANACTHRHVMYTT